MLMLVVTAYLLIAGQPVRPPSCIQSFILCCAGSDDVTARLERLEKLVMGLEDRLMTKLTELKDHGGNNGTEMME